MGNRLTKAQAELLRELAEGDQGVSESYAPGKALERLGLAERKEQRYGSYLRITPAGRAALAQEGGGE